jgi:transposase
VAVGRKAYLFFGAPNGGRAAATAFSLVETAKPNGVEPFAYVKDVLARIRSCRAHQSCRFQKTAACFARSG